MSSLQQSHLKKNQLSEYECRYIKLRCRAENNGVMPPVVPPDTTLSKKFTVGWDFNDTTEKNGDDEAAAVFVCSFPPQTRHTIKDRTVQPASAPAKEPAVPASASVPLACNSITEETNRC